MTDTPDTKYIPKIDKDVLKKRSKRIRPVVEFKGKKRFIKRVDIFKTSFVWDPKRRKKAKKLKPLQDVVTYHTWAWYGAFKPTIGECLAQIPEDILDKVVAFEIIDRPQTADDLNKDPVALNAGFHVAKTRYYGRA